MANCEVTCLKNKKKIKKSWIDT